MGPSRTRARRFSAGLFESLCGRVPRWHALRTRRARPVRSTACGHSTRMSRIYLRGARSSGARMFGPW